MADNKTMTGHPLDRQNEIERAIQLEGPKDPDNFKMPNGKTLTEVRQANLERQKKDYEVERQMIADRTRELSMEGFQKGGKLVMNSTGSVIDVTDTSKSASSNPTPESPSANSPTPEK